MNNSIEPPVRGPRCPAPVALEALSTGAPDAAVSAHLPHCAPCRHYVEALAEARDAYVKSHPTDQFLRKLERREAQPKQAPKRAWWWSALGGLAVATAAVVLAVVVIPSGGTGDGVTIKGDEFRVVARRGDQPPQVVADDARLRAGDALRFQYSAPEPGHLLVLNLDGTGKASVFHPFGGEASAPIAEASTDFIEGSVQLDDSPGPEWIVAVYSTKPLQAAPLLAQLRDQVGTNDVKLQCGDCRVSAVRILKD